MKNNEELYRIGAKALKGLTDFGVALGLTRVTKVIYEPVYLNAKAKSAAFATARQDKKTAFDGLRIQRDAAKDFLLDARLYFSAFLGDTWSALWTPLGFPDGSLTVPTSDAGRCQMLEKIKDYFTAHPELQNAARNFTAARAESLCSGLNYALVEVNNSKQDARTKRDTRDAAETALVEILGRLRGELELVLTSLDPRWLAFFDRIPGDERTPERVENVSAQAQPGGIIALDWENAERAGHYKVFKQVVGVDPAPVLALSVNDSDAQLTGLPSGATVRLQIVATNGVGDAPPSPVVELQAA